MPTMDLIETRTRLRPQDFTTQLYAQVFGDCREPLSVRVAVAWGQPGVQARVIEFGHADYLMVFDREAGGAALLCFKINYPKRRTCFPPGLVLVRGIPWPAR